MNNRQRSPKFVRNAGGELHLKFSEPPRPVAGNGNGHRADSQDDEDSKTDRKVTSAKCPDCGFHGPRTMLDEQPPGLTDECDAFWTASAFPTPTAALCPRPAGTTGSWRTAATPPDRRLWREKIQGIIRA